MKIELSKEQLSTLNKLVLREEISLEKQGKTHTDEWNKLNALAFKLCEAIDTLDNVPTH